MDTDAPATPTLAAVRLARAQRDLLVRRLRPAGLLAIAIVVISVVGKRPGPGLHGDALGVLLALAATVIGGVTALSMNRDAGRLLVVPFVLLLGGSTALLWLQPGAGTGALGFFVAVAATMRLMPEWRYRVIIIAGLAAVSVALVLTAALIHRAGHQPTPGSVLLALLPGVVLAAALLTRRLDRDSYQIERLLIDLERAQDAEVRAAALAERQRLAREMHDVLAHSLSGLTLQLEGARLLAIEDSASSRLTGTIERAHHLARSGLQEARRAIGMLRDEELPGPERLAGLAAEFERDSGLPCAFTVTGEPRDLDPEARLALYRVAQEALTNVRKHSRAGRVEIRLGYEPDGTRLTVEDFGPDRSLVTAPAAGAPMAGGPAATAPVASAPAATAPGVGAAGGVDLAGASQGADPGDGTEDGGRGYGLTGMRERAELLGGRLTTTATPTGFRVELWVPR
jgi:signal transduction histidine kinase